MKNLKKIIAVSLILCMVFSLTSLVYAENVEEENDIFEDVKTEEVNDIFEDIETEEVNKSTLTLTYAEQIKMKNTAHEIAELARSMGLSEDDPIIKRASDLWWEAHYAEIYPTQTYSDEDLRILTNVIHFEACCCPEWHKELVGQVVLNRVADSRFPNTIKDVVAQPGQYSVSYTTKTIDCQNCNDVAKHVLEYGVDCPENIIYQANFKQGKGVYKTSYVNTGWFRSTTYFCYG